MYLLNWGNKVKNCDSCQQRQPTGKNVEKKHTFIAYWHMRIILEGDAKRMDKKKALPLL